MAILAARAKIKTAQRGHYPVMSHDTIAVGILGVLALSVGCGTGDPTPEPEPEPEPGAPRLEPDGLGPDGLALGEVELGASGTATVTLRNTGAGASPALTFELTGPQATAFELDLAASTCPHGALPPAASCQLAVRFVPTEVGPAAASLLVRVAVDQPPALQLSLTASARPRRGLTLTFSGTGKGAVRIITPTATELCRATCTVPIAAGTSVRLTADTPSRWGGFAGACTATATECSFTAAAVSAVSARFDPDPKERLTLLFPGVQVLSVDYDPSGDLVVGSTAWVRKLNRQGATLWSRALAGQARAAADGSVLVRAGGTLTKLDAAGVTLWSVSAAAGGCAVTPNRMARTWAVMPDGGVAIQGPSALVVVNADGSPRFTTGAIGPACRGPVAVGGDNRIYTGVENPSAEPTDLLVFEADGTAAPPLEDAAPQYHLALAARGRRLAIASSGHSYLSLRTLSSDAPDTRLDDPDYVDHGLAIDDDGDVVSAFAHTEYYDSLATGVVIRRYAADLTARWSLTKPVLEDPGSFEITGVTAADLALDDTSRDLAIGGRYLSPTFDGGWVEIFAEP